ncbi:peptidase domain-containing ABC transporter [Lentisphaerota bacterium WC36G]|nr:peptidase domain-containing ABC transporter [Lentisphaerae bacterium WC36]
MSLEKIINNKSGLLCLKIIAASFRPSINFLSVIDEQIIELYKQNSTDAVCEICEKLELPFQYKTAEKLEDIIHDSQAPLLLKLINGNFICIADCNELNVKNETINILDPLIKNQNKILKVPRAELLKKWAKTAIVFSNINDDIRKNPTLFALVAVARHHELKIDVKTLEHEYSIDNQYIHEGLLVKILKDYNFKVKKIKLTFNKMLKLGESYPLIAYKENNHAVIICGIKYDDNGVDVQCVIRDSQNIENEYAFYYEEEFKKLNLKSVFLIKRKYSLKDEEQPFGLRWFIPEFIRLRNIFAQIALAVVMISCIALVIPLFFQIVVDKVLTNQSYNTLNVLGIGIILALIFNAILDFARGYLLIFATNKIDINTASRAFNHLMKLPLDFFEKISSGVLIKHMQQTEKIRGFLSGSLFFTVLDLFSLIIFIPFIMLYSAKLSFVVIGFAAMMALVAAVLIKPFQARLQELYQAEGKKQSMLVETIHGIKTVKSLSLEPAQRKHWDNSTAFAIGRYFRVGKISLTAQTISKFLEKLMTISVIWLGALMVFDKELSIGSLIAFQMISGRVTAPLVKLVSLIHEYQQTALSVKMLGNVMNAPTEVICGTVQPKIKGNISFSNISFKYNPTAPLIIKNFNLDIKAGTTIGIVGKSGSGKTTLTKLLQGLYPINEGLIKIDGIDIKEINLSYLRRHIGVVLQDNYFFTGSVRENICLTKKMATDEEVVYATTLAGAHEFIQNLPQGYDTILDENASNLSGGQKQRLAIARALLTNPQILIFDEATSALDPESEAVIQKNLQAICRGRTVLIISHRLSMVHDSDLILVVDEGKKDAVNSHHELLNESKIYQEFWYQQMGRYYERQC